MSITPEALAAEFSLSTAATRLDFLSRRDNGVTTLNTVRDDDSWSALKATDMQLDMHEALELLALGEVVARKAHDSRLIGIRAALRGGADWEEIAMALGVAPDQAWETFLASVEAQLEADAAVAARELAGSRPGR